MGWPRLGATSKGLRNAVEDIIEHSPGRYQL
jgi:hypothetical protein